MFSGNPDYEHSYTHTPMKSELSTPSKFIRLLDNNDDIEMSDPTLTQFNETPIQNSKGFTGQGKIPDKRYMPIASSSQAYSFNESEKAIIDRLRKWS